MDLKNIFYPFELVTGANVDKRVNPDGTFVELKALIERLKKLYPSKANEVATFFEDLLKGSPKTWDKKLAIEEQKVRRLWEADLIELSEFIHPKIPSKAEET